MKNEMGNGILFFFFFFSLFFWGGRGGGGGGGGGVELLFSYPVLVRMLACHANGGLSC